MSRMKSDMKAEQALSKFMDKFFYKPLLKEKKFSSIRRIKDIDLQRSGVDVLARYEGANICIDEKAQLYYINENLPTFAFELEYLREGMTRRGWLVNERLKTTHYFLLWPSAKTEDLTKIKWRDFTEVDGLIISKRKLMQYLDEQGLDVETLLAAAALVRKKRIVGRQRIPQDDMYLYASDLQKYSEAPINLVIRKTLLFSLADMCYRITQDGFVRLK